MVGGDLDCVILGGEECVWKQAENIAIAKSRQDMGRCVPHQRARLQKRG